MVIQPELAIENRSQACLTRGSAYSRTNTDQRQPQAKRFLNE